METGLKTYFPCCSTIFVEVGNWFANHLSAFMWAQAIQSPGIGGMVYQKWAWHPQFFFETALPLTCVGLSPEEEKLFSRGLTIMSYSLRSVTPYTHLH